MSEAAHRAHALEALHKWIHEMEPLGSRKNPFIAFAMGFLFGCLGVGLYLWSWKDFFYSLLVIIVFVVLFLPTGPFEALAIPIGFTVVGAYAAYRAHCSNSHF
jgi:hypothetical protein